MKKILLLLLVFVTWNLQAQTVFDYETPETSITFQIFGGSLEGALAEVIANPDMTGNESAMVLDLKKAGDAPFWGGAFSNPGPSGGIDCTNGGQVCMDVWMDHEGLISLKLEMADPNDPANYRQEVSNTVVNGWETICFDLGLNSLDGDMTPAAGKVYEKVVLFPDFGTDGTGTDVSYYIDNITLPDAGPSIVCTNLFDYETPETSPEWFIFGGSLEGTFATMVSNPDMSGANPSSGVMEYMKGADAPVWGGCVYELAQELDATNLQEVCIKYWAPNAGNLTFKLELDAFDDPENWIGTQEYSTPNEWVELCFDVTQPSFEGNMNPATGKIYKKFVVYPDFGTAGTGVDVAYYMDDFTTKESSGSQSYDVDFSVNMNEYSGTPGTVYVSGSFNDWSGDANPLDDSDGDGIWTGTLTIPSGAHEFKFTIDNWTDQEFFSGTEDCVISVDDGNGNIFVNRQIVIADNTALPTYCFNSCYACGESAMVTFNLGFDAAITVAETGVYIAGGGNFGNPGDFRMTDDDGDGIYSITFEKPLGFSSYYTFTNGACADYSCKEDISGQECADPANFNDRFLAELTGDVVLSTCFGECTDEADCGESESTTVTFHVDMNMETIDPEGVFIAGQFSSWGDVAMTDDDGDGIYSYTTNLIAGSWEWKFKNGTGGWEEFADGDPCTITVVDGTNVFINRVIELDGTLESLELDPVCFNSCDLCETNTNDIPFDDALFTVKPTVSSSEFIVELSEVNNTELRLVDLTGKVVLLAKANANIMTINVSDYPEGVYMIQALNDDAFKSQKVIITK